jgi:hypothetical protein
MEISRASQLAGDPVVHDEMKLDRLSGDFIEFHCLGIGAGWVSSGRHSFSLFPHYYLANSANLVTCHSIE